MHSALHASRTATQNAAPWWFGRELRFAVFFMTWRKLFTRVGARRPSERAASRRRRERRRCYKGKGRDVDDGGE